MVCSICGSKTHMKSNKKYHPKGSANVLKRKKLGKLTKAQILNELFGGAKKGLLADLLKGIDLRIKSY